MKFLGSEDGKIHVWNAESGMKVALLDGKHTGPVTCLQFNPKFMTFASACSNMVRPRFKNIKIYIPKPVVVMVYKFAEIYNLSPKPHLRRHSGYPRSMTKWADLRSCAGRC